MGNVRSWVDVAWEKSLDKTLRNTARGNRHRDAFGE